MPFKSKIRGTEILQAITSPKKRNHASPKTLVDWKADCKLKKLYETRKLTDEPDEDCDDVFDDSGLQILN